MIEEYTKYIKDNFCTKNGIITSKKYKLNIHSKFLKEIDSFLDFKDIDIGVKLNCILRNELIQKTCKYCNLLITNNKNYFKVDYCSKKCSALVSNNSEEQKEKYKNTMLKKYGVDNIFKNKETIELIQKKRNEQMDIISEKVRKNIKNKYLNNTFCMSKQHLKLSSENINLNDYIINNKFNIKDCINKTNYSYSFINQLKYKNNFEIKNIRIKNNKSQEELSSLFDFISNDRQLIKPLEIDLLNTNNKFGIEYNGLMWHSFGISKYSKFNKIEIDKFKHLLKTNLIEEKGYQLFHIFEDEFLDKNKKEIWFSIIRNKLKLNNKLYARKCIIKEVSAKETNLFLDKNHIQGKCNAKIRLGLYFNDELVSLMTFSKSRYNKNVEYELIRFCSKINTTIIGAGSKLLKYFEKNYKPRNIISYANRRFSQGKIYEKLGFKFIKNTEPNYFYFKPGENKLLSRVQFQKHKLKEKLEVFNSNLTELENMINNGYRVIYDCGNKVYIKEFNE